MVHFHIWTWLDSSLLSVSVRHFVFLNVSLFIGSTSHIVNNIQLNSKEGLMLHFHQMVQFNGVWFGMVNPK